MGRITSQVVAGIEPPPDEPAEEREYRERTEQWLVRMRRDAEQRGLNLFVEIPSDWVKAIGIGIGVAIGLALWPVLLPLVFLIALVAVLQHGARSRKEPIHRRQPAISSPPSVPSTSATVLHPLVRANALAQAERINTEVQYSDWSAASANVRSLVFPPLSVLITPRYREALASGEDRHRDQRRKGKAVPYISHLDGLLSFLKKAARTSWELPTAQVQLLVGAKPLVSTFSRYGCSVRPSGRYGQETSWRVER